MFSFDLVDEESFAPIQKRVIINLSTLVVTIRSSAFWHTLGQEMYIKYKINQR